MDTYLLHAGERPRVRELVAALQANTTDIAEAYKLPPIMASILALLVALPVVSTEDIEDRLQLCAEAKTAMYRLRTCLRNHNITIRSTRRTGYWLDDETKQRIREELAK